MGRENSPRWWLDPPHQTTMNDCTSPSPWLRRIGLLVGALMVFGAGWQQGDLAATTRISSALHHVAPSVGEQMRDICPRELTREASWSQSCLDLLPVFYFIGGKK